MIVSQIISYYNLSVSLSSSQLLLPLPLSSLPVNHLLSPLFLQLIRKHHLTPLSSAGPLSWRSSTLGGWIPVGPWWKKRLRIFKLLLTRHPFLHRRAPPRQFSFPIPLSYQVLICPVSVKQIKNLGGHWKF